MHMRDAAAATATAATAPGCPPNQRLLPLWSSSLVHALASSGLLSPFHAPIPFRCSSILRVSVRAYFFHRDVVGRVRSQGCFVVASPRDRSFAVLRSFPRQRRGSLRLRRLTAGKHSTARHRLCPPRPRGLSPSAPVFEVCGSHARALRLTLTITYTTCSVVSLSLPSDLHCRSSSLPIRLLFSLFARSPSVSSPHAFSVCSLTAFSAGERSQLTRGGFFCCVAPRCD